MLSIIKLLLITSFIRTNLGLIAYDCGGPKSQITEISLVHTTHCAQDHKNITVREVEIQLIQPLIYKELKYIQCLVEIEHIMFRCGKTIDTFSECSFYEELFELEEKECSILIKERYFKYNGLKIYIPKQNDLTYLSLETLGSIKDGSCTPRPDTYYNGLLYESAQLGLLNLRFL